MSKEHDDALKELFSNLHIAVGERLLDALSAAELDPRILKEAREYLKDNHVTSNPRNATTSRVREALADLDSDGSLPF